MPSRSRGILISASAAVRTTSRNISLTAVVISAELLDGWLFTQINGGNCISLQLNQGYGWAADENLRFIFDRIFSVERGCGYPENRRESQQASRGILEEISCTAHRPFFEMLDDLPREIVRRAVSFPGFLDVLDPQTQARLRTYLET